MKTVRNITTNTSNKGNHILLSIVDFNTEDTIITFGNYFKDESEIDAFKETKLFKKILNTISTTKP